MTQEKRSTFSVARKVQKLRINGCLSPEDLEFISSFSLVTYGFENLPLEFLEFYAKNLKKFAEDKKNERS